MNEFQQSLPITNILSTELNVQKKAVIDQINGQIDELGAKRYYEKCWTGCDEEIRGQIYHFVQGMYPENEFARALTPGSEPYTLAVGMASGYEYGRTIIQRRREDVDLYNDQVKASMIALLHASDGDVQFLRSRVCGDGTSSVINDQTLTDNLVFWIGFRHVRSVADSVLLGNVFGNAQLYDGKARSQHRKLAKKILKMNDTKMLDWLQRS